MNGFSRIAIGARNRIGRSFGAAAAYTPKQRWTAKVLWGVFVQAGYDDATCAALLGCIDGETSFLLLARGDHGLAGGALQWHQARRSIIKVNTGIDVWTADAADQARAVIAEMTLSWSVYRPIDPALRAAVGLPAKMTVLVAHLEQSGSQARDIARRTPMAGYWLSQFGKAAA